MKLGKTARWADDTRLYDAYTGRYLFKAQISAYIDNQQDGAISKRRVISYAPELMVPSRRVIRYEDEIWIVGDTMVDMWKGESIRRSAATKKVTGLYTIMTPGQAALDAGGVEAYAQLIYLKDTVDTTSTSSYSPQFEVYFSSSESVPSGRLLKLGANYYHVRSGFPLLDGFACAICDNLDTARKPVAFKIKGGYDSASDSYTVITTNTHAIELDYYKLYGKETADFHKQAPGDLTLLVAASAVTPVTGDDLEYQGNTWRVLVAQLDADGWRVHIRKV